MLVCVRVCVRERERDRERVCKCDRERRITCLYHWVLAMMNFKFVIEDTLG